MKYFTENELIAEGKSNLQILEKEILKRKFSLEEISEILPGMLHINSLSDFAIRYINEFGQKKHNMPLEEIVAKGAEFIFEIFEPGTLEYFSKPLIHAIQEDDRSKIVSFFQKVKLNNSDYEWLLTTSKFLKDTNEAISISQEVSGLDSSVRAISKLLDDNLFVRKNMKKFGNLTKREKQILKLVANRLTTKQVAEKLFLSPQTVKTHRKNICRKLDLQRTIDWEHFANAFDI